MDTSETYIKMESGLPDKPIPHTAISYLAGLVDGEGTVSIRRKTGNHFNIELYITSTNKPMLEWVVKVFSGTIYTYQRKDDKIRLPQQKWHIHGAQAEAILRLIEPYLIIKGEHARLAIAFREKMNRDTSWHREYADKVKSIQKSTTYSEPRHRISQDQLQEMMFAHWNLNYTLRLLHEFVRWVDIGGYGRYENLSMEQLWLVFDMNECYNKVWSSDKNEWVSQSK